VAFETRSVQSPKSEVQSQSAVGNWQLAEKQNGQASQIEDQRPKIKDRNIKREEIAAIVDKFLSEKIAESSKVEDQKPKTEDQVKTIIHQVLKEESQTNGAKPKTVDFVSEDDVKRAIENGEKIYTTAKTIITPSARDLGEEKEVFVKI
jgi:ethanolamine utilization cobalamin adenosyltransferase